MTWKWVQIIQNKMDLKWERNNSSIFCTLQPVLRQIPFKLRTSIMKRFILFVSFLFPFIVLSQNIGDNIHGGIVFYLNGNGGGLVALKTATAGAVNASWGCRGTIVNAGDTAIGTGYANTVNILSGCTNPGIFADIISQLTHEGYSDWYMPSKYELQEIRDVFWGNGFTTYFAQSPN